MIEGCEVNPRCHCGALPYGPVPHVPTTLWCLLCRHWCDDTCTRCPLHSVLDARTS